MNRKAVALLAFYFLASVLIFILTGKSSEPSVRDVGIIVVIVALVLGFVAAVNPRFSTFNTPKELAICAMVDAAAHVYLGAILAHFFFFSTSSTYPSVLSDSSVLVTFMALFVLQPVAASAGFTSRRLERFLVWTAAFAYLWCGLIMAVLNGRAGLLYLSYVILLALSFLFLVPGIMLGAYYLSVSISARKRGAWPRIVCLFGFMSGVLHMFSMPFEFVCLKGLHLSGHPGIWCLIFLAVVVQPIWLMGIARILWTNHPKNDRASPISPPVAVENV